MSNSNKHKQEDTLFTYIRTHLNGPDGIPAPYRTLREAKEIKSRYDNILNSEAQAGSTYIQEMKERLITLQHKLLDDEQALYQKLGINANSHGAQIRELQDRVNKVNTSGLEFLLAPTCHSQVWACVKTHLTKLTLEQTRTAFSQALNYEVNHNPLFTTGLNQTIGEYLNSQTQSESLFNNLDEVFTVSEKRQKNGKNKITVSIKRGRYKQFDNDLRNRTADYLINFQKEANSEGAQLDLHILHDSWDIIANDIWVNILSPQIHDSNIASRLRKELLTPDRLNKYAHSRNKYVIQGWMGELYWNICLNYLLGTDYEAIPSGLLQNIQGKQLSVDILLRDIAGFQVKTWHGMDFLDAKRFKREMLFNNFIDQRAELDATIKSTLAQMFGIVAYGDPEGMPANVKAKYGNAEKWDQWYYSQLQPEAYRYNDLAELFSLSLDKIMEIDSASGAQLGTDGMQITYMNTIWLINDKVIPSSVIVQKMIDKLYHIETDDFVSLKIDSIQNTVTPIVTNSWPYKINDYSDNAMLSRWRITYTTEFYLDNLLNEIEQML